MPAGNVIAEQVGTTLTLIGDELDNSIRLLPGSQPNEIVVQGEGTTVNGVSEQTFQGVENLFAHLLDGNDSLRLIGVVISTPSFSQVFVDGNAGDDRIELIDTTIHAAGTIDLQIYGERVIGGFASGTSGNDTIRIVGSSLTANAFVSARLVGETNDGGVVTAGNDEITIADSELIASEGFFHGVVVEIYGDINTSLGGQTSTIGGGNDKISISDTTIVASSEFFDFSFQNTIAVTIVGDFNDVRAFDPTTFSGKDAAASIGGGNDTIDVTNTSMTVSGVNFGSSFTNVMIVGDRNFVSGFLPDDTTAATIGGGNDSIAILDGVFSSTGAPSNGTFVEIRGEDIQVLGPEGASTTSTIGGGNDRIDVRNTPIFAGGEFGASAALVIRSEHVVAFGSGASIVGGGNDRVNVHNVQLPVGRPQDFGLIWVETGTGNDRLEIIDSKARAFIVHLGDGNDRLTFNTNFIGEEASLDGGPGFDRIDAHGNTGPGVLIWFNFEEENVTP